MIDQILQIFNTRELAIIIWTIFFIVFVSFKSKGIYRDFYNILKNAGALWKMFGSMLLYVSLCIFILYKFSWWNLDLLKITIFWFFGWALVVLFKVNKINTDKNFLKKTIFELAGFTAFISFVTNFYTFHLLLELILVPFLVLVGGVLALAQTKGISKITTLCNGILAILGLTFLVINGIKAVANFREFASITTLQEFTIPIILSIIFLPYLYFLAVYMKYEQEKARRDVQKKLGNGVVW